MVADATDPEPLALADAAFDHVQTDAQGSATMAVRALELARAHGAREAEVAALHALSYAYDELGDRRSLAAIRRAIRVADRHGLTVRAGRARRRLAHLLATGGSFAAATRELDRACAGFDELELARTYVFRVGIAILTGHPAPPRSETDRALAMLRAAGDGTWEARLRYDRGMLSVERGDAAGAEADFTRARDLYVAIGAREAGVAAELQLAKVTVARGDLPAALARLDTLPVGGLSPVRAVEIDLVRAQALAGARLTDEALRSLRHAQTLWRRSGYDDRDVRLELVRLTLLAGDAAGARRLARRAEARFTAQPAELYRARAVGLALAAAIAGGGIRRRTVDKARRALAALEANGWRQESLRIGLAVARAELVLGDPAAACEQLERCRSLRRRGPVADRIEWWHVQALIRVSGGDRTGAQRAARAGLALLDRHRASLGASELRVTASAIGLELARLGLRIALDGRGSDDAALDWSERFRASALRLDPVTPSDPPALRDARRELRLVTARVHRTGRQGRTEPALLARQAELESLIRRRSRHAPGLATPSAGHGRPKPTGADRLDRADRPRLAAALGTRALVELIELDGALTALTLVDGRLHRDELGAAGPVHDELEWLRFALTRLARLPRAAAQRPALSTGARASAATLAERLVAPLAHRIADRELVLVPTGPLHAMPWSLLPGLNGRTVTTAPSAAIWLDRSATRRGARARATQRVVLVSGPGLRHARSELNAIAELYPDAITLSAREATVTDVLSALDGAAIAHLACHGRFRADSPLFSSLELADGALNAYELQQLTRAPELVVLSACDLAVSGTHPGDELLGFASALLNMGTRSVIASSLPVVDVTAKRLMRSLHELLRTGLRPAAALAAAQTRVSPRSRAPTAFVCLGGG